MYITPYSLFNSLWHSLIINGDMIWTMYSNNECLDAIWWYGKWYCKWYCTVWIVIWYTWDRVSSLNSFSQARTQFTFSANRTFPWNSILLTGINHEWRKLPMINFDTWQGLCYFFEGWENLEKIKGKPLSGIPPCHMMATDASPRQIDARPGEVMAGYVVPDTCHKWLYCSYPYWHW